MFNAVIISKTTNASETDVRFVICKSEEWLHSSLVTSSNRNLWRGGILIEWTSGMYKNNLMEYEKRDEPKNSIRKAPAK